VVAAPISEEFFFRLVLQSWLEKVELAMWVAEQRATSESAADGDPFASPTESAVQPPVDVSQLAPGIFPMFGGRDLLGRPLPEGDEASVVLSYDYWQRRFGGDVSVIDQRLPGAAGAPPRTVVGVMPEDFIFPYRSMLGPSGFSQAQNPDIWLLLTPQTGFRMVNAAGQPSRSIHHLSVLARPKPGFSTGEALRQGCFNRPVKGACHPHPG